MARSPVIHSRLQEPGPRRGRHQQLQIHLIVLQQNTLRRAARRTNRADASGVDSAALGIANRPSQILTGSVHGESLPGSRTRCRNAAHAVESTLLACRRELDRDWFSSRHETTIGDRPFLVRDHLSLCLCRRLFVLASFQSRKELLLSSSKMLAVIHHRFFADQTRSGPTPTRAILLLYSPPSTLFA